jgi:hypothetical protein
MQQWLANAANVKPSDLHKLGPVDLTFRLVNDLCNSGLAAMVDEETMTGAVLGAMMASFPWVTGVLGLSSHDNCCWQRYRKSGSGDDSERVNGADFALFVRRPGGKCRVAIFQAKLFKTVKEPWIDLHHIPASAKGDRSQAQFLKLRAHGLEVLRAAGRDPALEALSFVHYAGYSQGGVDCVALCDLGDVEQAYTGPAEEFNVSAARVMAAEKTWVDFGVLLTNGTVQRSEDLDHWLELDDDAALRAFRALIPFMTVGEINDGHGGPRLFPSVYGVAGQGELTGAGPTLTEEEEAVRSASESLVTRRPSVTRL